MTHRIVVVGAGIAGLATTAALQGRGHSVTVLEQRDDASPGAGISIWPNALAALDRVGLGDAVRSAGGAISAGALRWHDGSWLRHPSAERMVRALGEPLVVVRRAALRDILAGALAPGTLRYGLTATAVVPTGDTVRVAFTGLETGALEADAVVGADGTHSLVARMLNGPLASRYAGYTAWRGVADFRLDPDVAGETLGAGLEVGHVPMGADRTYWFATERLPEGHCCADGELAYLMSRLARWADPIPAILAATRPQDVLRNDLYDRAPARRWTRGRVVIVGDAAHPMRPHLGQGGCQGIEDAAILAELLDCDPDPSSAFARFEKFRRPRVRAVVRESRMIGQMLNLRPALLSAAASRATVAIPEALVARHLAGIAAQSAFRLPA